MGYPTPFYRHVCGGFIVCVNDIGSLKSNDDVEDCWVLDLRVQVGY